MHYTDNRSWISCLNLTLLNGYVVRSQSTLQRQQGQRNILSVPPITFLSYQPVKEKTLRK
jgi:hypothetical protein